MKKYILTGLICLFSFPWIRGQEYIPQITHRHYTSDSTLLQPRRPWKAALETFGLNMLVWGFDRYLEVPILSLSALLFASFFF